MDTIPLEGRISVLAAKERLIHYHSRDFSCQLLEGWPQLGRLRDPC